MKPATTINPSTEISSGAGAPACGPSCLGTNLPALRASWLAFALLLGVVGTSTPPILCAAETDEEGQLIQVLQRADGGASLQEVGSACDRLQRIGTARSVPHLAKLLNGTSQIAQSARQALETMPDPAAGQALIAALATTEGMAKAGVATSLGVRHEARAVPALAGGLSDANTNIATAVAFALGKIGGTDALSALKSALANAKEPVRSAVVDGLLACAYRLLADGKAADAAAAFQPLTDLKEKDFVRIAAFRGLIQATGPRGLKLATDAIAGDDGAAQVAALQLARELPGAEATRALAGLLAGAPPSVQSALLEALSQRGDPAAAGAVLPLAASPELPVRIAAMTALGSLADAQATPVLLNAAASTNAAVQKAAREALLVLHRGDVTEHLLAQLSSAQGSVQAEVIRALSGRAETSAVPRLLELAARGNEGTCVACLRALAALGEGRQVGALTQLLLSAKSKAVRNEAQRALGTVCQRAQTGGGQLELAPILRGLGAASRNPEGRAALLQVCSLFVDPEVRSAMRASLKDPEARVRDAAIRAVCDSRDPEFLSDLMALTRDTQEASYRALAIRGYVRLVTEENGARAAGKSAVELLKPLLIVASRPEEQRVVLAGLATVPDLEALKLVSPMLGEATVKEEAAQAILQIAPATAGAHPQETKEALQRVLEATGSAESRNRAVTIARQIEQMTDYLTAWQMAGPYRETGKDYAALFDIVFPPETPGTKDASWKPLPAGTDPARPWLLDLLKALGGEQAVAYARTAVFSEKEQSAVLELGSDDGAKVWLNGKLVHANNVARPITPGSDKVPVTLRAGWNPLLLKVTQNNLGWEFSARFVRPDGSRLEGLRVESGQAE
jgi:HEAT repeat protein